MFLLIVLSIITAGAVMVGALYSSIIPFFAVLGNTADYNMAYYWAIGSTERALLSVRYHKAWYEWRGWFSGSNAVSGMVNDVITGSFGRIATGNNSMQWSVTSRNAGIIPMASGWDVERLLQWTGSKEFNMLGYDGLLELPIYLDTSTTAASRYTTGTVATITAPNDIYIQSTLRLPPKILAEFWGGGIYKLDDTNDIDNDQIKDDIMVNWWLKGINLSLNEGWSIIPTIRVDYNIETPIYDFENAIRESHINDVSNAVGTNTPNFFMGEPSSDYEFNVISQPTIVSSLLTGHNAIPADVTIIDYLTGFSSILNSSDTWEPVLSLNLVNKLSSTINQVFPFLEYQIKVCEIGIGCNVPVSDRYFRIDAAGKVGEYDVHIRLHRSVTNKWGSSDFAIIF